MTKLLEQAIAEVRKLSDEEQDSVAAEMMIHLRSTRDRDDLQISDADLADLRRRRAENDPEHMSLGEVEAHFRRSG